MKQRLKVGDLVVVVLVAGVLGAAGWYTMARSAAGPRTATGRVVVTNFATNQTLEFDLACDASYNLRDSLGDVTITVQEGRACISRSSCPDQLCVTVFGWVQTPDDLSVCMPNRIMLKVDTGDEGGSD